MALKEYSGLMKPVDKDGNESIFYPVNRAEDVAGLEKAIEKNLVAAKVSYNGRTVKSALETLEKLTAVCAGVEWDYNNPPTELKRLIRATDPHGYVTVDITEDPVPAVGTGAGSSPFDGLLPWAGMEEYNVENGAISAIRGDGNFSRSKDTVVHIPEFYYYIEDDAAAGKRRFYISNVQIVSSFEKHPGSGRYVAKYNTGPDYVTRTGFEPLTRISRATARTGSTEKGKGWYQYDYATWCAVWLLYLVEYANWNIEPIGPGNVSSGTKKNTGGTDAMVYHTGRAYDDENNEDEGWGFAQVQYRHIEDPWGNVFDWVDGVNFNDRLMYFCLDPDKYADDTTENYTSSGMSMVEGNGFISKLGYNPVCKFAFIPAAQDGDSESYIPDYAGSGTGWRVLRVGGYYYYSSDGAGLFCFYASNASTSASASNGARLLFIP